MKKKVVKKPLTIEQIAHQKFLKKMGVLPKQIKDRKLVKNSNLRIDTIDSIRKACEND